jgi:hypothetical protein
MRMLHKSLTNEKVRGDTHSRAAGRSFRRRGGDAPSRLKRPQHAAKVRAGLSR